MKKNNGILIINKPAGPTSRDIVNKLNKIFNTKKIGHTGTLDPIATGVLVICIGKYTKLVNELTALDKEYVATIKFGVLTDTLDITGNILKVEETKEYPIEKIKEVLDSFLGESVQETPKYSAVKINGKKLYEYARSKEEIELPKRKITISEIEVLNYDINTLTFRVKVSKGTYIRSLINDICLKLGTIGTMQLLNRTKQGEFIIENSYNLEEVSNNNYELLQAKDIFPYEIYELTEEEYIKVKNGNHLNILKEGKIIMLYKGEEIAIYEGNNGLCKCYKMLNN
ncbi:MAG: tRNA pseudouridine(55) synthase TruB [Bacilli bacterium]|nr:tRNA pseudouridine(55) synthase TruB [Bacilli bacterium]